MSNPIQNATQIQQGIDFIRAQTQPETITNEHVANVLEAMQKPRILRNLVDSVQNGQLQINTNGFPTEYPENSVIFTLKSSTAADEDIELVKGSNLSFNRWALGEPEYELFVKNEILGAGLPVGQYYQLPTATGGQILFGNNLGSVAAGTSLGKFTNSANLYLQKTNIGQELIKASVNMKITQNVPETDFPFTFMQQTQYFGNEIVVKDGAAYPSYFYNAMNYKYLLCYTTTAEPFTLQKAIKVETFQNGNLVSIQNFSNGQTFYQNSWNWAAHVYDLQPNDNIEIVISEVI